MSGKRRLTELGMPTPLAVEVAAQIDSGTPNTRRLIELSMAPPLAKEVAAQITSGTAVARRLLELGMVTELAKEVALQIGVEGGGVSLSALSGTFSLAENAALNAVAGALSGKTTGSTLSLTNDAGGRVALSGANIVRGATVLDYEAATSHSFTVRETLAGATNTPRDTVLSLTVTNVLEVTLGAFTLSATEFVTGVPSSGTIIGAQTGETITPSGLPSGLTIDGPARTWAWDGTGTVSAGSLTLTGTHPDGINSPRDSVIGWEVVEQPEEPGVPDAFGPDDWSLGEVDESDASLPAPYYTITTAPDEYPPEFEFEIPPGIPVEVCDLRFVGGNEDFSVLKVNILRAPIGTGGFIFPELATITGETFFRARIENPVTGTYGPWSIVRKHGDTTPPVLSGDDDITEMDGVVNPTGTLTCSEVATFEVSGPNAGLVTLSPGPASSVTWTLNVTTDYYFGSRSFAFSIVATDQAGLNSEPFPITYHVAKNPAITPDPQWSARAEDKHVNVTLSNDNTTATVSNIGVGSGVRLVRNLVGQEPSATSAFEGEVTYSGTNLYIGFCYGAAPLNQVPGRSNNLGVSLKAAPGGWEIYANGSNTPVAYSYAGGLINGDVLRVERVGLAMICKLNGTTVGPPVNLPSGAGDLFAFFAGESLTSITADFTGY